MRLSNWAIGLISATLLSCRPYKIPAVAPTTDPTTSIQELCSKTKSITISSELVELRLDDARANPALRFTGGFHLASKNPAFSELSGLHISPDGRYLVAITDEGKWIELTLNHDPNGRLLGIDPIASICPMLGQNATSLVSNDWRDAEGLARSRNGAWHVTFERQHRILSYEQGEIVKTLPPCPGWNALVSNGGMESLAVLADERLVTIAERPVHGTQLPGWVWSENGCETFMYDPVGKHKPTGLATTASAKLLILERHYSKKLGNSIRIGTLQVDALGNGNTVRSQELTLLKHPLPVDNFEGIAYRKTPTGSFIYLISDDNADKSQRTLLYQFAWNEGT